MSVLMTFACAYTRTRAIHTCLSVHDKRVVGLSNYNDYRCTRVTRAIKVNRTIEKNRIPRSIESLLFDDIATESLTPDVIFRILKRRREFSRVSLPSQTREEKKSMDFYRAKIRFISAVRSYGLANVVLVSHRVRKLLGDSRQRKSIERGRIKSPLYPLKYIRAKVRKTNISQPKRADRLPCASFLHPASKFNTM